MKTTCNYCRASLDGTPSNRGSRVTVNDQNAIIVEKVRTKSKLKDVKASDRQKVKDAIRKGENEIILKQHTRIQENPLTPEDDKQFAIF